AVHSLGPLGMTLRRDMRAVASGIVAVATAVMARALKRVSVARGVDPRRMALIPFGGAGPLFGCALADALGMRTVVVPPHPGALSALGLAAAAERVEAVASLHRRLDQLDAAALDAGFAPLVERDGADRARLARDSARLGGAGGGTAMTLDAVGLEVMAHAFASVAEEMGLVLIHSALSPNIRERRDCSAAVFDADGQMIAQAAHIPVHLGAMAEAVAAVRAEAPRPGEIFLINDPYTGGTHLPDLTLVGAIALDDQIAGYSVVRAHHSDVGGMQPGSMPAGARELVAEG